MNGGKVRQLRVRRVDKGELNQTIGMGRGMEMTRSPGRVGQDMHQVEQGVNWSRWRGVRVIKNFGM
jgi:hypothetical protein